MSKRLQVVLQDAQLERYENTAKALGMSLSAWVRQVLSSAERQSSLGDVDARLASVRTACEHAFPAPEMDRMLAEIELGYSTLEPS
jgi:hypothetical protein